MKRKRKAGSLLVAVLVVAAGCGQKEQEAGFSMPPTSVETAPVTLGAVADRFSAVGSIEASEAVIITSEIDGKVTRLPFREGTAVRQGDPLAELDAEQLGGEARRAAAVRDQAHTTYKRLERLVEEKISSPQDLDAAAADLKVAEANLVIAETRLGKTRISAPFAGIIGARRISPGAFVHAGDPITELAQIDRVKVTFSAPERYLGMLARGTPVVVSTAAFADRKLTGTVDLIEPALDEATRALRVTARVQNPDGLFRPGMSADISAVLGERPRAMLVPSEAVFAEGDQFLVYVVKPDSTAARTSVTLGSRQAGSVEVLSGLAPGMTVVRAGHQKLRDGAKVQAILVPSPAKAIPPSPSGAATPEGGAAESAR